MIRDTSYQETMPTRAEYEALVRKQNGRRPAVPFATCKLDGTRFWYSGIGKGAHERGKVHNDATRRAYLATPEGQRYAASMRKWEQEKPESFAAWLASVGGRRDWEVG